MKTTTITMTREFKAALRMAYFCCREIGHRNQSDYEIESNLASYRIREVLVASGDDPEGGK
jgi:hypothetical protein